MKRIRTLLLFVALFGCGVVQATITTTINGLKYSLDETTNEATLVSNSYSYSGDIVIPASVTYSGTAYKVTSIGNLCFNNCSSLTSVVIPSSVTTLGNSCFYDCSSLTSVKIGSSVTSLPDYCFSGCSSLTSVVIGSSVTSFGRYSFSDCSNLTSVEIPSSVTEWEYDSFVGSGLTSIKVDEANPLFASVDGVVFNKSLTELVLFPVGRAGTYSIPSSVTSLADYCFYYCENLTNVEIPSSVNSIGESAFLRIPNLVSVNVDDANSYYASVDGVLFNKSLTELIEYPDGRTGAYVIPSTVTTLKDGCFNNCSGLTSVEIPSSVTTIGSGCFYYCTSLTNVEIPSSVTSIGGNCFSGCSNLTNVEIGSSVASLGSYCFYNCKSLVSAEIGSSVTSIGYQCFYNCSKLTTLTFMGTPKSFGSYAFYNCTNIYTVNIPIGSYNNFKAYFRAKYIKETVLTSDGQGYSTICSTSPLNFEGTGVTAYIATVNDGANSVTLKEVTKAAAGEGLVVNAPAGSYVLPVAAYVLSSSENELLGVKSTDTQPVIAATDNCYALRSYDDGTVAFAKIVADLTFPYGKAYLKVSDVSNAQQLLVNFGSATSITKVGLDETEEAYYTISGVRVEKPTKGLYIRGGKKVYVK
ncbi:MAG: leucine-rich repeat domain-containing protein [Bacteroidales bacterium]|nr:leucine-rich repeat domain-containing protein [Bacteroidales bacterium]